MGIVLNDVTNPTVTSDNLPNHAKKENLDTNNLGKLRPGHSSRNASVYIHRMEVVADILFQRKGGVMRTTPIYILLSKAQGFSHLFVWVPIP